MSEQLINKVSGVIQNAIPGFSCSPDIGKAIARALLQAKLLATESIKDEPLGDSVDGAKPANTKAAGKKKREDKEEQAPAGLGD